MRRQIAEGSLSFCVVLLMFETASMAGNQIIVEPSTPSAAALPSDGLPAGAVPYEGMTNDGSTYDGMLESEPTPGPDCPDCQETPVEEDGFLGWRPQFPHFRLPSRSYSVFRSPVSYGWGYGERCAPTPWTPRGDGIPRRTSCYRMDYRPYELQHDSSKHGPAYYQRFNLYPCPECHEHAVHLQRFYGPRK